MFTRDRRGQFSTLTGDCDLVMPTLQNSGKKITMDIVLTPIYIMLHHRGCAHSLRYKGNALHSGQSINVIIAIRISYTCFS